MKFTQNLHTHSILSDGKDTIEEIILKAIEIGFDTIGFSDHSPMPFITDYDLTDKTLPIYLEETAKAKEKYKDKIKVLRGIELDMTSDLDLTPYDYVIGSVHCIKSNGDYVDFDTDEKGVEKIIDTCFDGNGMALAKAYYETVANEDRFRDVDFVGHFDIITKHLEKRKFFDVESNDYKNYALEALYSVKEKCEFFEINTGAVSRGYRTVPYPAPFILKEMNNIGCKIIISSDCHDKEYLTCKFNDVAELARQCGFKEFYNLTEKGFMAEKL
ncbi:MAG: histidinol-phosphatase HisJ family protein [Clostridia bacterium]|nr:histidinol-phosphatase HisJ family protein [Clostridia bacterium]